MPTVQPAVKMWSAQSSSATSSDNFKKTEVTFEETYQVVTSYDATELDVYTYAGLPPLDSTFPNFPFVYLEGCQLSRVSPLFWLATMSYRGEINSTFNSPLFAPPRIAWDDIEAEEEIDEDFDGFPITNTAGQRVRGIKAAFSDQVLTVTRNFLSFNTYLQAVYRRSVNSDEFLGWPPGTVKLTKLSAQNVAGSTLIPNTPPGYFTVTAVFQFRYPYRTTPDKAWYARYASMGLLQRRTPNGPLVPCYDSHQQVATTPQYLDAFGKQTDSDNVVWIERKLYGSLPYNALGMI